MSFSFGLDMGLEDWTVLGRRISRALYGRLGLAINVARKLEGQEAS